MVGHDDVVMWFVGSTISVEDGVDDHVGNFGLLKVQRAGARVVQQAIHGNEGFSRGRVGEIAAFGESAGETEGEESGLVDRIIMREAAGVEGGHA